DRLRRKWAGPREEDHELVAAETGDHVFRARRLAHRARERPKYFIPDEVTGRVVHGLESVNVAQHDAKGLAMPRRLGDLDLETLEQAAAVEHAGQVVVACQTPRLGEQSRVRDRDRGLRGVQTDETPRLVREG